MKSVYVLMGALILSSSAFAATAKTLGPVVIKSAASLQFCASSEGNPCLMTWTNAQAYCASQGGHLPTAREISELLPDRGTVTLEVKDVNGAAPAGFYLVEGINPDGQKDAFYLNHSGYHRLPTDDQSNYLVWTATTPPGYEAYAHVYYNSFGGGGGEKEDHLKTHPNNVMCAF